MALIHITRKHSLTREQARGKIDEMARQLADEFKVKHGWDGDVLRFKRSGATGAIALGDEAVDVKVKLGVVLAPMKGKIEKAIIEGLDKVQAKG
jgi:putative polyhydroxyalkanoate system protein